MMVQIPENRIARLGSSPITNGNTNVAPNIATTCCAPSPAVLPHGSRSSGATGSPGAGFTSRQLNMVDIWCLLDAQGTEPPRGEPHHTPVRPDFGGGTPGTRADRAVRGGTGGR